VAYKHCGALIERPSGVSLVTFPNIVFFQFLFTLLVPVMDLILVWTVASAVAGLLPGMGANEAETLGMLFKSWLLFQNIDVGAVLAGVLLDRDHSTWRLAPLVFRQRNF
jgi:hypothetical protein